ncbi:MAG: FAD-binding protein [Chloroflexi bacterium]|nr:FAD-binding protein [Chloroflexota bacterium]
MYVTRGSKWDTTAEVVVIGYGGSGAVAAITAAENGAEAIILEKQPRESHHTNTSMSGGIYLTPTDPKSAEEYLTALNRVGKGISWTDRASMKAWAEYAATGRAWVETRGGDIYAAPAAGLHPQLPGGALISKHRFVGMGIGMAKFLDAAVKARKIPVLYETTATHLLTNLRGRVVGVEVQTRQDGRTQRRRIRALKGVVLASGGFEFDEQMKLNYLMCYPVYFSGAPANTGDGIRMALEVGARLWHMNCVAAFLAMKFPSVPVAFHLDFLGRSQLGKAPGKTENDIPIRSGHIIVDRHGERYTSENVKGHAFFYELPLFDTHRLVYPRVPSYFVFDRKRLENGPLPTITSGAAGRTRIYQWSPDNSREIEQGWIVTADTVRSLARKIGVPADSLERTVKTFNRYCEKGRDPDFSRRAEELIPLESPPYCAVPLWPGGPNTQGGPQRNSRAQILNADGNPIPGLYGCGELGCVYAMLYPGGGGNLTDCFAYGRIAGESAARGK